MKDLILKDIKLLGPINIALLLIALMGGVFGKLVNDRFLSIIIYFYAGFLSVYLLVIRLAFNDVKHFTNQLLVSLPIKRFNIVKSRYIGIFIYVFVILGLEFITSKLSGGPISYISGFVFNIPSLVFTGSILLIFLSIILPLQYINPRKTQVASAIMYMFITLAPVVISKMNVDWSNTILKDFLVLDFNYLPIIVLGLSLIIYVASSFVSKLIFERKEF